MNNLTEYNKITMYDVCYNANLGWGYWRENLLQLLMQSYYEEIEQDVYVLNPQNEEDCLRWVDIVLPLKTIKFGYHKNFNGLIPRPIRLKNGDILNLYTKKSENVEDNAIMNLLENLGYKTIKMATHQQYTLRYWKIMDCGFNWSIFYDVKDEDWQHIINNELMKQGLLNWNKIETYHPKDPARTWGIEFAPKIATKRDINGELQVEQVFSIGSKYDFVKCTYSLRDWNPKLPYDSAMYPIFKKILRKKLTNPTHEDKRKMEGLGNIKYWQGKQEDALLYLLSKCIKKGIIIFK